ncbi:MAG: YtxH domain-containing protein [Flavobacterium sp.]|nr:YtxH domain-containing protein [Flavobacterium sp.]
MKNSNVLLGILGGVAVGAIAGILLAPDKGTKTRKKLKSKAADIKSNLQNDFDEFLEQMENKYQQVSDKATEVADVIKK